MLCARLGELLEALGLSLFDSRKMYYGPCPVHGGDNPNALNLYTQGDSVPGYWRCNTRKCHEHFKRTIIGFVRGVLSNQRHGWTHLRDPAEHKRQKMVPWKEAVDWCCRFIGTDIRGIEVDYDELEKRRFAADVSQLSRRAAPAGQPSLTRATVRGFLQIPAAYFVGRGWSPEVLDRYDVGYYPAPGRPLSDRVAVPVYDDQHRSVVGFTGRSVFPQCGSCRRWHRGGEACPDKGDRSDWGRTAKWFNHHFSKESHLYNYWFAARHVREERVAAIVEGPGEVWRLEEAGIKVGLGLFGSELSDEQQVLLEMSGAMNLVVLTNMDEAGDAARDDIRRRLSRSFRLHFPSLPANDLGEMTAEQVRSVVGGVLAKIRGSY